jgi:hypothetical protein
MVVFFLLLGYLGGDFGVYRCGNKGAAVYVVTEKGIGPPRENDYIRHADRIEYRLRA